MRGLVMRESWEGKREREGEVELSLTIVLQAEREVFLGGKGEGEIGACSGRIIG